MAAGVVVQVPNDVPRFVPIAKGVLHCAWEEAAERLRTVLGVALGLFADDEDCEDEAEDDFRLLFRERDLDDEGAAMAFLKSFGEGRPCTVRLVFRLLGGKGGFGALLRGQKGRGKKTTNMDAMRDLSGRRLRHSKAVERIKEWMEDKKRDDDLVNALTGEGPELPKPTPRAESLDPEYIRRLKRGAAERPALVKQGMRQHLKDVAAGTSGQEQAKRARRASPSDSTEANAGGWRASLDLLEGLSSPEEEPEQPLQSVEGLKIGDILAVLQDKEAVVEAGKQAGLDESVWSAAWLASAGNAARVEQLDADNGQVKCFTPKIGEAWFAVSALALAPGGAELSSESENDEEDDMKAPNTDPSAPSHAASSSGGSSAPSAGPPCGGTGAAAAAAPPAAAATAPAASGTAAATADGSAGASGSAIAEKAKEATKPAADVKPLRLEDVRRFPSADALRAEVSADVLKASLQSLGLKCGGRPEERAARLFLLKDKPLEELPKSAFAR